MIIHKTKTNMSHKSNIAVLNSIIAFCFLLLISSCNDNGKEKGTDGSGSDTSSTTYIRKNASRPEAAADLEALQVALAKMKQMPCDTTYSWYYQGGIHSVPDEVPNKNPLCPSYTKMSDMKTAWMNCTHDPEGFSELHFLIWHRLYTWHFEQIVRKLSGKKDFAMPYWDYTDTAYRVMPEIFRNPKDSLYESARLKGLNNGEAIAKFMNKKLDMTKNNQSKLYADFDAAVDQAPHGAMHNYIGGAYAGDSTMWNRIYQGPNYGLMANVPSAAFDPIFWVHHSNIDYLWQKWDMSANGARPILDSLLTYPWAYVFFDADGKKVEYTIQQALEKAFNLDYKYEGLEKAPKLLQGKKQTAENREEVFSASVEIPITTASKAITVTVPTTKVTPLLKTKDMTRKVTTLEIVASFKTQPRSDYEIYIDTDKADDAKLAGILTFFGAMEMRKPAPEYTKKFRFDVTDELDIKKLGGTLKFFVVKSGPGKAGEVTIKSVKLLTASY